jgi:hypothetical protein
MLALAISTAQSADGDFVETNEGHRLRCQNWPQDSEVRLISFRSAATPCQVVQPDQLAKDIARAISHLERRAKLPARAPAWLNRLSDYAAGARV